MSFAASPGPELPSLEELAFPRTAVRVLAACAASAQLCADLPLRDELAGRAFERLGGDVLGFEPSELRAAATRAFVVDSIARVFFDRTPSALGVGVWPLLGTRAHRLPEARWVDVDSPAVARLRRFVLPERRGWLQLATCACRSHWVDAVCGKADRRLLIVVDESVFPLLPEMAMRLLDDISRRVPAGSELVMAFDPKAPLRPAHPERRSPMLELGGLGADGRESVVRYPRLRFVETDSYPEELAARLAHINTRAGGTAPALAHLRLV